jgi:uncharacterized protein YcfJ
MLKYVSTIAFILSSTTAVAHEIPGNRQGTVIKVEPIITTTYTPVTREHCFETQVPVYQQPRSNNDALAGAIIGGLIGNQFGSGSGKDAMTILGAIAGANSGSSRNQAVRGYVSEWRCEMVRVNQEHSKLSHYLVVYEYAGKYYQIETKKQLKVGQIIKVQ